MEGYLAEIRIFAGNFAPLSWAFCQGQILAIDQNQALFALLGTTFGGNGQTTFALPDLRGRVAIGTFQGAGLSNYDLGQMGGTEANTLTGANVANHSHAVSGTAGIVISSQNGHSKTPVNGFPATNGNRIYNSTTDNSSMAAASLALTNAPQAGGGSAPVNNMKPYLAINFIICLEGIFPSRN